MVCSSPLMTETMTGLVVTVLQAIKEHGGTMAAPGQISMDSTSMIRAVAQVSRGITSMLLLQGGVLFAIQTWSWGGTDVLVCSYQSNPCIMHIISLGECSPLPAAETCAYFCFTFWQLTAFKLERLSSVYYIILLSLLNVLNEFVLFGEMVTWNWICTSHSCLDI